MIEIIPYGDYGLLINFEQKIDGDVHELVKEYYRSIQSLEEVSYQIPAYCSITVVFDNNSTGFEELKSKIEDFEIRPKKEKSTSNIIEIPVCYEDDFAPDLESLSRVLKITKQEIISLHTNKIFNVFMMGFLPGFPYLGKLPKELVCKRKSSPRMQVKSGSVGLAGSQTGIYPSDAPGGWQLIGQTPLRIFDVSKKKPFLLKMGDQVRFSSISAEEFNKIRNHEE